MTHILEDLTHKMKVNPIGFYRWATKKKPYDISLHPDWFIGILILAYYNPYITWVGFHPYMGVSKNGGYPKMDGL